jgi:hypothetical protein
LILGVVRLLNEDEVPARRKTYRKRVLRCQRTSSEASLRPFFPGQLGEGWQARGFHLCDLIQASMRSRLGSSSSQWPALRSAARRSPTTCSSVIRESSCIGYIQLATCAPVGSLPIFNPPHGTPQWLGRYSHRGVFDQWHAMRLRVGYLVSRLAVSAGAFVPIEWQLRRVDRSCGLGSGGLKRPRLFWIARQYLFPR